MQRYVGPTGTPGGNFLAARLQLTPMLRPEVLPGKYLSRRGVVVHGLAASVACLLALPGRASADDGAQAPLPDAAGDSGDALPAPLMSDLELQLLTLVNGARAGRGIAGLQWDPTMAEVSRAHAAEMMRRGIITHTGADGSTPQQRLRRAGIKFQYGSENIWSYWGKVPSEGPSTMHAAMMSEPLAPGVWNHIGNVLYSGYRRIGIGIAVSPSGVQYLSETFAD